MIAGKRKFLVCRSGTTGFTIVEMMMVLVVIAILGAMAAPSMREFAKDARIRSDTESLVTAVLYMRAEAMRLGTTVSMCPSADGAKCLAADLTAGWIIFNDPNGDGDRDVATEALLRVFPALSPQQTIALSSGKAISVLSGGRLAAPLSLHMCDERGGNFGSLVSLNLAARPTVLSRVACP